MRKDILAIIGLLAILAIMVGTIYPMFNVHVPGLNIHGYDGPIARITEMEDRYAVDPMLTSRHIADNNAYVYPIAPDPMDLLTMCGVRMEIRSAPNVLSTTFIETLTVAVVDHKAETNKTRNWDVHKAKCSMGVTVWTYEGGIAKAGQTTFWITLSVNPNSIFSTTEDHYDSFIHVYNIDPVAIVGEIEVTPSATGDYVYTPVDTEPMPSWIIESGYTGEVNNHRSIKFPVTVLNAQPALFVESVRVGESSATFNIGFDVIIWGYWEQTVDYRDWRIPEPEDWLGMLISFLTMFAWVLLGFVATILIFRFVPDLKLKLLATGIVWLVLLSIYGINAITVWLGV